MFKRAIEYLRNNEVIVYPTETVYGLGADALSPETIIKVFETKNRPRDNPISLAIASLEMVDEVARIDSLQRRVLEKNLPGPITFLVRKKKMIPDELTGGSEKVGIRFPDNWVAQELIKRYGKPITSTSANLSGKKAPTRLYEVNDIAKYKLFGGKPRYEEPSTVYDLVENKLIRRGPVSVSEIRKSYWN